MLLLKESNKLLKCLRIDNGGEYCSNAFKEYCNRLGIKHEKPMPGTPQRNGVAERMNRTIMEKVRSMLFNSSLEKNFWAEAVRTTCYLINRSPTTTLDGSMPEEVWTVKHKNFRSTDVIFNESELFKKTVGELEVKKVIGRSSRPHKPSQRYTPSNYILLTDEGKPNCFQEACKVEHSEEWKIEMEEEMNSLLENKTWELLNLLKGRKALQNKLVYMIKHEGDKNKEMYKARLVVKGFAQKEGIEFTEIFSPVVKMSSIRVILGLVVALDLECEQLDVKTTFLHGELEEEIYVEQ
eukprot:PITA_32549